MIFIPIVIIRWNNWWRKDNGWHDRELCKYSVMLLINQLNWQLNDMLYCNSFVHVN